VYVPSAAVPGVKPTATRAGMPNARAITAKVLANCTQNPRRSRRNLTMAFVSSPLPTLMSYVKLAQK
jgi:hypothetical protein